MSFSKLVVYIQTTEQNDHNIKNDNKTNEKNEMNSKKAEKTSPYCVLESYQPQPNGNSAPSPFCSCNKWNNGCFDMCISTNKWTIAAFSQYQNIDIRNKNCEIKKREKKKACDI